jgi:hypothetical protein
MAVKCSRHSSVAKQSEILRSLASINFMLDPALQNIDEGRANYKKAAQALENRNDAYSYYTRVPVYRNWAVSELAVKNLTKAGKLLEREYSEWMKIPTWTGIAWSADLRTLAYNWGHLGIAYFQGREDDASYVEKGRLAFREAQKVIETLSGAYGINNDYTIDARGLVFQWWGQQEYASGFWHEGQQLLTQAEQEYQRCPTASPGRTFVWLN